MSNNIFVVEYVPRGWWKKLYPLKMSHDVKTLFRHWLVNIMKNFAVQKMKKGKVIFYENIYWYN